MGLHKRNLFVKIIIVDLSFPFILYFPNFYYLYNSYLFYFFYYFYTITILFVISLCFLFFFTIMFQLRLKNIVPQTNNIYKMKKVKSLIYSANVGNVLFQQFIPLIFI